MKFNTAMIRSSFVLLILGLVACSSNRTKTVLAAPCEVCPGSLRDTHERMHAVLWMQQAAEYKVLTASTFESAKTALAQAKTIPSWTAEPTQTGNYQSLPKTAVILDIDETVLDNSPFQGKLIHDRVDYDQARWDAWSKAHQASAIEGAKDFVDFARAEGVDVFFITSRTQLEESDTLENLVNAKLLPTGSSADSILCKGENNWPSEKEERRKFIAQTHRILLLIGDDLGDFLPKVNVPPADRWILANKNIRHFGKDWFLLPNAIYGSWERNLPLGTASTDAEKLDAKRKLIKQF